MPITPTTRGMLPYSEDAFTLDPGLARDLEKGDAVLRGPGESVTLPTAAALVEAATTFLGIVINESGGERQPSPDVPQTPDGHVNVAFHARNVVAKVQDGVAPALDDPLTLSTTEPGRLRVAVSTETVIAISKKAIAAPGVDLTTRVDLVKDRYVLP